MKALLLLALLGLGPACGGRPALVVEVSPPAPLGDVVAPRPDHVWVEGRWQRIGERWLWRPGYWMPARPGYLWVQGTWTPSAGHYHWVPGYWRPAPRRQ